MNETWTPYSLVGIGADPAQGLPCHIALGVRGEKLVGWARIKFPGMATPVTITADANLREIEEAIGRHIWRRVNLEELREDAEDAAEEAADERAVQLGADPVAIQGRRARRRARRRSRQKRRVNRRERIKRNIKRMAKKVGNSKVMKGIARVAKKVVNNPVVKGVLSVVPGGQAVVAAQAAGRLVGRAVKGGKKARKAVKAIHSSYKRGNPKAGRMMQLVRQGMQAQMRGRRIPGVGISGDELAQLREGQAFALIAGACAGPAYRGAVGIGSDHDVNPDDDRATGLELDAVSTFADEGPQWEPMRWALMRLGPGFVPGDTHMTARDALMEGRNAQAARYRPAGPGEPWDVRNARGERFRAVA